MAIALSMSSEHHERLLGHLDASPDEQAAFLFTAPPRDGAPLRVVETYPVPQDGLREPSPFYLALSDEVRGLVIGRAARLGGCLVEAHSHPHGPAGFSATDLAGFEEWVPHVRWRLDGRPYVALVFAGDEFDALAWGEDGEAPGPLDCLSVSGRTLAPTGITHRRLARSVDGR